MLSAIAIAIETVPGLPQWMVRALIGFEAFILVAFTAEYLTRIYCSQRPLRYILSFWGIIDLLSCAPALVLLSPQFAAMRTLRLLRLVRVLKLLHTNRALRRLEDALQESRGELGVFAILAGIILYIAAVGIYIFEHEHQPEAFSSIPVSLWWAVVSFTTVGYGDIYPITAQGRLFTALVLFVGLGVIAVPTAIITRALINAEFRDRFEEEIEEDLLRKLDRSRKGKRLPVRRGSQSRD